MYRTVMLIAVLHGYTTLSFLLRKKQDLRYLEKGGKKNKWAEITGSKETLRTSRQILFG